jgi:hypothetical protein
MRQRLTTQASKPNNKRQNTNKSQLSKLKMQTALKPLFASRLNFDACDLTNCYATGF